MLARIDNNCNTYYKNKVSIKEAYDLIKIQSRKQFQYNLFLLHPSDNNKDTQNNPLCQNIGYRKENLYKFFFYFRNSNKLTLNLISHVEKNDFEKIANFIVHNFYENILSASFAQEDMLVLIYLLIEKSITTSLPPVTSINSLFDQTFLLEVFKSMTRKEDVRLYLQALLSEIILKTENITEGILSVQLYKINPQLGSKNAKGTQNFILNEDNWTTRKRTTCIKKKNFRFSNKEENLGRANTTVEDNEKEDKFEKMVKEAELNEQLMEEKEKEASKAINEKEIDEYFSKNECTLKYLQEKLNSYSSDDKANNEIRDYLDKQISKITTNNEIVEIFSNKAFLERKPSAEAKKVMMENAEKIKNLLDILMKNLLDNLTGIPYSIKCICTIIDTLTQEKFEKMRPRPTSFEQMMYVVSFFFGSIIIPIISNPDYNGIITTNIISTRTKRNLQGIVKILQQILKGNLFTIEKDFEFTVFNRFIVDFIPGIVKIINWVRNTKLPFVIEKLITKKNDPNRDIEYDYFKENHNENIQHQSICFNFDDALTIVRILKKHKEIFENEEDEVKKTIEKVLLYESDFTEWIEKEAIPKSSSENQMKPSLQKREVNFICFSKLNYRKEFEDTLNGIIVHNQPSSKIAFDIVHNINNLQQEKEKQNKKDKNKKVELVEGIKKCLIEMLSNVNVLTQENLDMKIPNSSITGSFDKYLLPKIINIIKYEYMSTNQISNIKLKGKMKIPLGFYSTFLEMNLKNLNEAYSKDNYSLLFTEMLKECEAKAKEAKNDVVYQLYLKVKNSDKLNMIVSLNLHQLKQLEQCINVEKFVEEIPIAVKLDYTKKNGEYSSISIAEIKKGKEEKFNGYCDTITSFIKNFPDFTNIETDDLIAYEEKLEVDKLLLNYFLILKNSFKKHEEFSKYTKEQISSISDDLENYIITKIYDKIYPRKRCKKDIKIYKKCKRLEWIKPKNLIKEKKVVNEKLWQTAMEYINKMDSEKTPADKIKSFGKAYSIIQNSITFCTGKDELGVDDSIQVLIYVLLKAKPKRIWSNFSYSSLFIDPELSKKQYGLLLTQMEMIVTIIENMKYSDLIEVTEEEFGHDIKDEDIDVNEVESDEEDTKKDNLNK